jgi:hypothetical protein
MLDPTVRVFDGFYNTDLIVNGNEYEVVNSFFRNYTTNQAVAKSFTETLFRISDITKVNVLELLDSFQAEDSMKIALTMAYYLNTISNKTVMYGVGSILAPVTSVQRNVVQ